VNIVFRVDASLKIGAGHVMRCLTLANALKQQGAEVEFICREHEGNLIERIEQQDFQVYKLPQNTEIITEIDGSEREKLYGTQWLGSTQQQDAEHCKPILEKIQPDWLIVDHYAIDQTWQALLKENYKKIMVIDDLANRQYHCDILLDQTYGRKEEDYLGLVPKNCQMLLGPRYAILRPEFAEWRDYSLKRRANPELKKLLITMGGVDPDNMTGQVLEVLKSCDLPEGLEITVVMGETAPNIDVVEKKAKKIPYATQVKTNVNNMAELMANADLAIGAAGATTWERCCLGLPSILVVAAENQIKVFEELDSINAIESIWNIKDLLTEIEGIMLKSNKLSLISSSLTDGEGVYKAAENIYSSNSEKKSLLLKPVSEIDRDFIYGLQTKQIRKYFRNRTVPSLNDHINWYKKMLKSHSSQVFILMMEENKVGMLRVDNILNQVVEVSIIISSSFSGQGLAKKALSLIEKILLFKTLKAVIHRENIASKKVFKSFGFELEKQNGIFEEYLKNV